MSIGNYIRRNWFALALVALHTLLVGAWAWIELDHAWNDLNPTMLVMAALHVIDYPIHLVLHSLINNAEQTGSYLAALLLLGGIFWFVVGWFLTRVCRAVWHTALKRSTAASGA